MENGKWKRAAEYWRFTIFHFPSSIYFNGLLFLVLAVAWTWPLVTRLSSRIPHDLGDPLLNAWILWWNTQAAPVTEAWWSPPIFFPMRGAFALSEHLAGVALFTAPLHAVGVNALAAYNVALILSCWLSGFFAFLLGRKLTGSTAAGLPAGVAFGFAPYRASQLAHLQVLTAQWMPLALLAMHSFLGDRRRRLAGTVCRRLAGSSRHFRTATTCSSSRSWSPCGWRGSSTGAAILVRVWRSPRRSAPLRFSCYRRCCATRTSMTRSGSSGPWVKCGCSARRSTRSPRRRTC